MCFWVNYHLGYPLRDPSHMVLISCRVVSQLVHKHIALMLVRLARWKNNWLTISYKDLFVEALCHGIGSMCMCIDCHALNALTIKNKYSLPKVNELFNQLLGSCYFTKIDLKLEYHHGVSSSVYLRCKIYLTWPLELDLVTLSFW